MPARKARGFLQFSLTAAARPIPHRHAEALRSQIKFGLGILEKGLFNVTDIFILQTAEHLDREKTNKQKPQTKQANKNKKSHK